MATFSTVLGGIGLFLLGMVLMTNGLKAAAGDGLRLWLQRATKGPVTGLLSGALVTAIVQSSSATTLATIGFVSAGLLPFTNAVGLILGANIGTTTTGWLVSLFGFKFSIAPLALPLIGVGALCHLLARNKLQPLGLALAGFGLIFVAIDTLQSGMTLLSQSLDPSTFGGEGLLSRLILVIVGIVMTILMQSSTAASITTMAALHAGSIDLYHAAALVVGQNIGTTATAIVASTGAGVPTKRTALAHVLFNVTTGFVVFLVLPYFIGGVDSVVKSLNIDNAAFSLAVFHTSFSALGIVLTLPFIEKFSRLIERIVPEKASNLTISLDTSTAEIPAVAVEATRNVLRQVALELAQIVQQHRDGAPAHTKLGELSRALTEVRSYLAKLATQPSDATLHIRHVSLLHVTDHLERLLNALKEPVPKLSPVEYAPIKPVREGLDELVEAIIAWGEQSDIAHVDEAMLLAGRVAQLRRDARPHVLSQSAAGAFQPGAALTLLEHMRWLDRASYHMIRAVHHLQVPADNHESPDTFD